MDEISILYDKIRYEEKSLHEKAIKRGLKVSLLDAKNISLNTSSKQSDFNQSRVFLQRCLSHYRSLYLTTCLEFLGLNVINSSSIIDTCGNKLKTSLKLAQNNIPTPKTHFAFSVEGFKELLTEIGYPKVLKPIVGSWGRGVFPLRNQELANMILEIREEDTNPLSRIYYVQEMIKRPPRDIRCIVIGNKLITSVYRYSADDEWRTNVARGGRTEIAPITKELEDIVIKTSEAIGGGILGVDLMEDLDNGLVVHEVNNNVEFRGASLVSHVDIADAILDYLETFLKR